MNKTVTLNNQKFQMYQAPTGWIFVRSTKTKRTYSVAKIENGVIVTVDSQQAINGIENRAFAEAWLGAVTA